jgi:hypothetical protein
MEGIFSLELFGVRFNLAAGADAAVFRLVEEAVARGFALLDGFGWSGFCLFIGTFLQGNKVRIFP